MTWTYIKKICFNSPKASAVATSSMLDLKVPLAQPICERSRRKKLNWKVQMRYRKKIKIKSIFKIWIQIKSKFKKVWRKLRRYSMRRRKLKRPTYQHHWRQWGQNQDQRAASEPVLWPKRNQREKPEKLKIIIRNTSKS